MDALIILAILRYEASDEDTSTAPAILYIQILFLAYGNYHLVRQNSHNLLSGQRPRLVRLWAGIRRYAMMPHTTVGEAGAAVIAVAAGCSRRGGDFRLRISPQLI